jgi:hypothetical protein
MLQTFQPQKKMASLISKAHQFSSQHLFSAMQFFASGTNEPFELIPIVTEAARNFDSDHEEDEMITNLVITHADDLNA